MLVLVGSVPAEALIRAVVRACVAAKTEHAQTENEVQVGFATVVPTTTADSTTAVPRAPVSAPPSGADNQGPGASISQPATAGLYSYSFRAPSAPVLASGQPAAPARHYAVSRSPGTPSIIGGPQPATAYNYAAGLIVDSTDNPGGITSIGAADTLTVSGGTFSVGSFHTGVFTQSGGTVTLATDGPLVVGDRTGSNGTYTLQGGTLNANSFNYIGSDGVGTFNQTGGTFNINAIKALSIGRNAKGTYILSGGTLTSPETRVGDSDTGVFTQSGSSIHNVTNLFLSNFTTASSGTYNLDGGFLNVGQVTRGNFTSSLGTGIFNFNGGTLRATKSDNPGAATNPTTFFGNLTTAQVRDGGAVIDTNNFNVTVSQGLVHSGIGGDNATDGGLTKNGAGTLTLTGVSAYTGGTNVNAGTLAVTAGGLNSTGTVNVNNNSTLALGGTGSIVASGLVVANGTFNQSGGTFGSTTGFGVVYVGVGGAGTINQTGGTFNASGNGGGLLIGYGGASNSSGTYNLSGATSQLSANVVFLGYAANGTVIQSDGSFTVANDPGSSTFVLGYFTGITGTYTLSGGTLSTGGTAVGFQGIGNFSQSGGSFTTNGSLLSVGKADGAFGQYTLGAGTLATGSTAITGGSSSSSFTQSGGSHLTGGVTIGSAGTNSAGIYNLDGGTLLASSITGVAGTSRLLFNGGTVQPLGDSTNFISGITGANVRNGGAIFDTNGKNVTVPQVLAHSNFEGDNATDGGLTKNATGILSLTGANTYTGVTTVNGGTLAANNTNGSATGPATVYVLSAATLAGSGTIAGNVILNSGATLSPGNGGPGRLTIGGTLSLGSGSGFMLELGGTTAGSQYDQIVLSGPLTAGGLFNLSANLNVTKVNGFTLAVGQKFFIIDETATNPVGGTGTFANAPANIYTDAAGDRFLVNYADINPADGNLIANDVSLTVLSVAAVPEPSTWAAVLGGAGLLGLTLRRRRA